MLRIMLLDDDENMKTLLGYYLRKCAISASIDQFLCAEDARNSKENYDLWIVDHRLKNSEGMDFIRGSGSYKPFIYESFYLNDALNTQIRGYGGIPLDKNDLLEHPESIGKALRELKVAA